MPICKKCKENVDEVASVKVGAKRIRVCEDCLEEIQIEADIDEAALGAMRGMMEYKG